jgi:hypothetical protein
VSITFVINLTQVGSDDLDLLLGFAYGEMYLALTALLNRFEFEFFDTNWERDVAYSRDCFIGEPSKSSPGMQVQV